LNIRNIQDYVIQILTGYPYEIKSIEGLERIHLKDGLLVSVVYNSEEELDENSPNYEQ